MGRTAPARAKASAPKGCGRIDCCQVGGAANASSTSAQSFPRFSFKPYSPGTELIFPPGLAKYVPGPLKYGNSERQWLRPTSLEQLLDIKAAYPNAKLVGGSTEIQIEVKFKAAKYPVSVFISDIEELFAFSPPTPTKRAFEFGANLPLAELEDLCKEISATLEPELRGPLDAISTQLRYFAGKQVRLCSIWCQTGLTSLTFADSERRFGRRQHRHR